MSTILVTGVASALGAQIARRMADRPGTRVIGLDREQPERAIAGVDVHTASISGHGLTDLLRRERVETVVRAGVLGEERLPLSREAAVQQNVLAGMELLGACAQAGVRRVVLRSSTLVYGLRHDQPVFIPESRLPQRGGRSGLLRDYSELEAFASDFMHKQSGLQLTVLRCASLVGADVSSPLVRYLSQRRPRVLVGFNPRIQVLHPNDAVAAFMLAADSEAAGAFNIAAEQPLTLWQAIRLAGGQPDPLPSMFLDAATMLLSRPENLIGILPLDPAFLRYACVADTQRARVELGWQPHYSAEDTLRELKGSQL